MTKTESFEFDAFRKWQTRELTISGSHQKLIGEIHGIIDL